MYTIKEAAARSGITIPLLRAWERRYGVVEPARTPSGYRLYDDRAMQRLRAMRRLVEGGWTPSNAAAHLRDAPDATVDAILREPVEAAATGSAGHVDDLAAELTDAFVAAAGDLDEAALEGVLDAMFASGSFEQVAERLVMPGLVALGEGWADGRVTVAAEHAAANAVGRRIGGAFLAAGRPDAEPGVALVGLPPGARHELGALTFATALRRSGVAVRYLGADLPEREWVAAARRTNAVAAVIGAVIEADVDPARRVVAALRRSRPDMVIALGGSAAPRIRAGRTLVVRLPGELVLAVDAVRGAIAERGGAIGPG